MLSKSTIDTALEALKIRSTFLTASAEWCKERDFYQRQKEYEEKAEVVEAAITELQQAAGMERVVLGKTYRLIDGDTLLVTEADYSKAYQIAITANYKEWTDGFLLLPDGWQLTRPKE